MIFYGRCETELFTPAGSKINSVKGKVTNMENKRICKKCLFRDKAPNEQIDLNKYLSVISENEKTPPSVYEKRLNICRQCDLLLEATCQACGCYVEFRAAVKHSRCPKKKW